MRWISIDAESKTIGISFNYQDEDCEKIATLLREGKIFGEWYDVESEEYQELVKLIPELKRLKELEEL